VKLIPSQRPTPWRQQIRIAALDPFRGYLNALCEHLPAATHVLDAFYVTALGIKALDEVRAASNRQPGQARPTRRPTV
jgi:transposase